VLQKSTLAQSRAKQIPEGRYLLGDGGYPNLPWLVAPYRDKVHQPRREIAFNGKLSSYRSMVERSFGRLKNRWQRLYDLNVDIEVASKWVLSACILHNLLMIVLGMMIMMKILFSKYQKHEVTGMIWSMCASRHVMRLGNRMLAISELLMC
jgi:hypothetical protein